MVCKFNDCGWCYCTVGESNDINGQCLDPDNCKHNSEAITYHKEQAEKHEQFSKEIANRLGIEVTDLRTIYKNKQNKHIH